MWRPEPWPILYKETHSLFTRLLTARRLTLNNKHLCAQDLRVIQLRVAEQNSEGVGLAQ